MRAFAGGTRTALLLALALAAGACGGGRDREGGEGKEAKDAPADGRPERGGVAILAELSDMERPHPLVYESSSDSELVDVLYMGLSRGAWRDGRLVYLASRESPMALAWHWELTGPDSTALRYRMRSGLVWSDGRPITAADVVWTYRMLANEELASPRHDDVGEIDSVVAENDSTVVFHFARRYPGMLYASSIPIAPRHAYEAVGVAGLRTHPAFSDPTKLVVSGPFRVGDRRPGERFTLVPNERFPVRPYLDQVVVRVIPEATTRIVELRNGTVDMVRPIAFDQVPALRQVRGLRFEREEKRFVEFIAYNPAAHPAFADSGVRRALGMALDVAGMVQALQMGEFAVPAGGPYPPIFRGLYDPRRMAPLAYDTAGARRILEARGWRDADGDGIREKDGRRLTFTLTTNSGNQRRADVSQIAQQQWRAVGVDVQLRQLEFNTFMDRMVGEEYEAILGSWGVPLEPDLTAMWSPEAPFNIVSYRNPEVLGLFEQARAQPTDERALPFWRAAAERIVQDHPYTWLYYYDNVVGVSDRLRGTRIDTFGAYQNMWEWWSPRSQQRPGAPAAAPAGDSAAKTK